MSEKFKATMKLRFVQRPFSDPPHLMGYAGVLQQWWGDKSGGEWRDVPVEQESE